MALWITLSVCSTPTLALPLANTAALLSRLYEEHTDLLPTLEPWQQRRFMAVLEERAEEAQVVLTRLQRTLTAQFFMHEERQVFITFSAGVTLYRPGERLEEALVNYTGAVLMISHDRTFVRALADRNDFPRPALVEAALRYVEEAHFGAAAGRSDRLCQDSLDHPDRGRPGLRL